MARPEIKWSMLLGGAGGGGFSGIQVDLRGRAIVTGFAAPASPSNLAEGVAPVRGRFAGGTSDALWMTIAPDLSQVLQATWLGAAAGELALAVHLGSDGRIRMVGSTLSPDLPVSSNALQSKFVQGDARSFRADGLLAVSPYLF
ncbi:MAG: hypothetical protein NTV52_14110 [Acidobacteria bacterium]|nr:hypothetical protein [Acidobacteriota bacterium]